MSMVNLVSGGLDSTLVGLMAKEEGVDVYPLFIDYGQRASVREWETCVSVHKELGMLPPKRMDLSGFGKVIQSGLTQPDKDIYWEAFTPCRNLLFLIAGGAYAYQVHAKMVAIGLLSERFSLFPDQRAAFVRCAETAIAEALGVVISVVTPLSHCSKAEVMALAAQKGLAGTYSCHAGARDPCGKCISCLERMGP